MTTAMVISLAVDIAGFVSHGSDRTWSQGEQRDVQVTRSASARVDRDPQRTASNLLRTPSLPGDRVAPLAVTDDPRESSPGRTSRILWASDTSASLINERRETEVTRRDVAPFAVVR